MKPRRRKVWGRFNAEEGIAAAAQRREMGRAANRQVSLTVDGGEGVKPRRPMRTAHAESAALF